MICHELTKLDNNKTINISSVKSIQEAYLENRDIDLVKETLENNKIKRTGMELLFGFYVDANVSFDLYLQDEFFAHYNLQKCVFTPLSKTEDMYHVFPLINLPYMKETYIKNKSLDSSNIVLIGAVLKHETYRKEIQQEVYWKGLLEIPFHALCSTKI
jgi:hypothetical protein